MPSVDAEKTMTVVSPSSPLGGWRPRAARILNTISCYVCYAGAVIVFAMPFPIVYEAIVDHLNAPTDWVFELSGYAMIFVAFLASGYGLQTGRQFRITLVLDSFPKIAPYLEQFNALLTFAFGVVLAWAGWVQAYLALTENLRSDTLLSVPQFWPELALPIGGAVIALQGLSFLIYPEGIRRNQGYEL